MGDVGVAVPKVWQARRPAGGLLVTVEQATDAGSGLAAEPGPGYDWGQFGRSLAAWVQQAVAPCIAWCGSSQPAEV